MTKAATSGAKWQKTGRGRYDCFVGESEVIRLDSGEKFDLGRISVAWAQRLENYSSAVRGGAARAGDWSVTIRYINATYQVETFPTLREAKEAVERWVSGGVLTPSAWV